MGSPVLEARIMKLWKSSICGAVIAVLVLSCVTASATSVNDGAGDIWHWRQTGTAWSWVGNVGNKQNIDITEISYEVNGNKITLKMEVAGSIQTAEKIAYYLWYNSTDTVYMLSYMNGEGTGVGWKGMNFTNQQNVTVSGDTLSVVLDVLGDTSKVDLWGMAVEYTTTFGDQTNEWWGDWAPNEKFTQAPDSDGGDDSDGTQDGDDSSGSKGTPGFEMILVLAAGTLVFLFLRRRR